jgi:signal recognition particle receptor subunit beta
LEPFDSVIDFLKEIVPATLPIVIAATKSDIWRDNPPQIVVDINDLKERVIRKGLTVVDVFSTSARDGYCVDEVFGTAAKAGFDFGKEFFVAGPARKEMDEEIECNC